MLIYDCLLSLEVDRQFLLHRKLSMVSCIFAVNKITAVAVVLEDVLLFHAEIVSHDCISGVPFTDVGVENVSLP